jgi:ATP-binding protein involved in chromosome partitioning
MFRQVRTEILGLVENMSYLIAPKSGERVDVFGNGGGKLTAENMRIPFLGELPLDPEIRKGGDSGNPVAWNAGSPFDELAEQVKKQLAALKPSNLSITVED